MSAPKLPAAVAEIGVAAEPFQYAVHDPGWSVCRKASVRYLAPDARDCCASEPLLVSQASKYGANRWAGSPARACAVLGDAVAALAVPATVAAPAPAATRNARV